MNKKIILVGGTVVKAHLDNNCFADMTLVKKYFGMSPFSLGEQQRVNNVPKTRLTLPLRFDANNGFSGFLKQNPADFIFLDLQKILADLLEIDGHYCTNQPDNKDEFYSENQDKIVTVTNYDFEHFYPVFDGFAKIIRQYYKPESIVLLSSLVPAFYSTGRQVRNHKNKFKHNNWYSHFEKRFCDLTGCVYYDKCRYYINEKRAGKPTKFAVFESEYYSEAAKDFGSVLNNSDFPHQPDYIYSVQRYVRYIPTLNKGFLSLFLSNDDSVDSFLMSCPEKYAAENCKRFALLKEDGGSAKSLSLKLFGKEFLKTYKAFLDASENPVAEIKNIDLLFKNGIMLPSLLKSVRNKSTLPIIKQITYNNYGDFYFGRQPKSLPTAVDVIGTCVSRFIFNFNEDKFAVNNYAFHYMPIKTDVKARYDESLFDENIWAHKMMKLQADCGLRDFVSKSKAEWAVVDLFTLIELTAFLLDGKPIGAADHFGKSRKLGETVIYESYSEEEILSELKKYAELLKSLYGNQIILVASRRQFLKVDDTGKIVHYTNKEVNTLRNNKCRSFEKAFCDYCGCWYVDIVGQFYSHDQSFVTLSPVHYEDDCYLEEGKIIKKIIDEKPQQKVFSDYDTDTRLKRILDFKESGNEREMLKCAFNKWQDEIVCSLTKQQIERNRDFIKSLYSENQLTPQLESELKKRGFKLNK